MALARFDELEAEWGKRYPVTGQTWRRAWEHVVPFFAFARRPILTHDELSGSARAVAAHQVAETARARIGSERAFDRDDRANRKTAGEFFREGRYLGTPLLWRRLFVRPMECRMYPHGSCGCGADRMSGL
jgi:hypothetical protein